jgi:uncharacterized protein (TIGR03663 family)
MSDYLLSQSTDSRGGKLICALLFLLSLSIAVWFRFDRLDLKPLHHDEGVNSYFLLNLARDGKYKYDPENFHGPSLYYFTLASRAVLGDTDFALRFMPALFGVLTILLLWPLRGYLGVVGTPAAAMFLALSPGLVYFSRDFIHEMMFGCLALGLVVGAWRYASSKQVGWMVLGAISTGLMIATKETVVINLAVIILAGIAAMIWDGTRKLLHDRMFTGPNLLRSIRRDLRAAAPTLDHFLTAIIIIAFIHIIFYSSFFTNAEGATDFFKSIYLWTKDRSDKDHVHPFAYYLGILLKLELPLLAGGLLGGLVVLLKGSRFWLFTAAWTLGTVLAYSLIPYKTPWLMVSFLIPLAIMTGYAAEQIYLLLHFPITRVGWALVIIATLSFCGKLSARVNFQAYDDNGNASGYFTELGKRLEWKPYVDGQYGYVYAQTDRQFLALVDAIKNEAKKHPEPNAVGILVATPEYWPLPWYMRDYKGVAFAGKLPEGETSTIDQPIVLVNENQHDAMNAYPDFHVSSELFELRPGVSLQLYSREDPTKH